MAFMVTGQGPGASTRKEASVSMWLKRDARTGIAEC